MPESHAPHPDPAQLAAFDSGALDAAEWTEVERHVAECEACCRALEGVPEDRLLSLIRTAVTLAPLGKAEAKADTGRSGDTPAGLPAAAGPAPTVEAPPELANHPRYRIVRCLGAGGMGSVFLAEHKLMERLVALKVIHWHLVDRSEAVERFRQEVKAAARLSHPNIVTAYDADQAGSVHFLVMEYVEGVMLDKLLREQGRQPVALACDWIRQAALGLQHAADRGMVHRDIKPGNILLRNADCGTRIEGGQPASVSSGKSAIPNPQSAIPKILDFGLALFAQESAGSLTPSGMILGTPDYIAPEQALHSSRADIRADIYSLGCTLYHLLAGQPPFPGGTAMQKLMAHQAQTPKPVRELRGEVPEALAGLVDKMLAKAPAERYQTPAEVAQALTPFCPEGSEGATQVMPRRATPGGKRGRLPYGTTRRRLLVVGLAVAAMVVALASWLLFFRGGPSPELAVVRGQHRELNRAVLAPDCARAFVVVRPGGDKRWNLFELWNLDPFQQIGPFEGHKGDILGLAFSPDGKQALSAGTDGEVKLWDLEKKAVLKTLAGHEGFVRGVCFHPDARYALSTGNDGQVIFWNLVKGDIRKVFRGHAQPVSSVAVSRSGSFAVTAGWDRTVRVWDLLGQKHKILTGHNDSVSIAVFSSTGGRVLSGSADGTMRLWDVEEAKELKRLADHTGTVRCVAFAADDRRALSGDDKTVRLWDLDTGREVAAFQGHEDHLLAVAFCPDGRRAVSASKDGSVRFWRLP